MLRKLRVVVDKIVLPLGRALGRAGLTPNMVSVAGLFVFLAGATLVALGMRVAGGWVLLGGGFLDLVDGGLARAMKLQSKRGAFIDSTVDRASDGVIFAAVAWYLSNDPLGLGLALTCLVLGTVVSYIKARAEGLGFTCEVGVAERPERVTLVAAGLIFNILLPTLGVLAALSAFTAVQRFVHVYAQARRDRP